MPAATGTDRPRSGRRATSWGDLHSASFIGNETNGDCTGGRADAKSPETAFRRSLSRRDFWSLAGDEPGAKWVGSAAASCSTTAVTGATGRVYSPDLCWWCDRSAHV